MSDMPSTDDYKRVMEDGPQPEGERQSGFREESPNEDELGRATPNYPLNREDVPGGGQSDGEGAYSQNPE